jgi:hypothetical protein
MIPINQPVVTGFQEFPLNGQEQEYAPKYASPACLSEAKAALWTNRVPAHEPWPRVMKGDTTPPPNAENDEYTKNVRHHDQYDNETSPAGLEPIGKIEGDEKITRNKFWRR